MLLNNKNYFLFYVLVFALYILCFAYERDIIVVISLLAPCVAFYQKQKLKVFIFVTLTLILCAFNFYPTLEPLEEFRFLVMKPIYQYVAVDVVDRSQNINDMLGVICDVEGKPYESVDAIKNVMEQDECDVYVKINTPFVSQRNIVTLIQKNGQSIVLFEIRGATIGGYAYYTDDAAHELWEYIDPHALYESKLDQNWTLFELHR